MILWRLLNDTFVNERGRIECAGIAAAGHEVDPLLASNHVLDLVSVHALDLYRRRERIRSLCLRVKNLRKLKGTLGLLLLDGGYLLFLLLN